MPDAAAPVAPAAARSYLYVPGDQPDKIAKASGRGADALVLDLEDAVAPASKREARGVVAEALAGATPGPQWWVRVDAEHFVEDLAALTAASALTGVLVPKAEPGLLDAVDEALTAAERRLGLPPASLLVLPLLESARGLARLQQVAAGPRVLRLGLGEADLAADLGILPSPDRQELWPYRAQVVLASAAAGIAPPVGPVETDVRNDDQLLAGTKRLLAQGFRARTAIHPRQLAAINAAFAPTADDVRAAEEVVRRYEAGAAAGVGVTTTEDGRLVDLAVVRNARRVLELAGRPHPNGR